MKTLLEHSYQLRRLLISYHATKNERFKHGLEDFCDELWQDTLTENVSRVKDSLTKVWRDRKLFAVKHHLLNRLRETATSSEELENILAFGDKTIDVYQVADAISYFIRNLTSSDLTWTDCTNRLVEHSIAVDRVDKPSSDGLD